VRRKIQRLIETVRWLPSLVRDRGLILLYHRVSRLPADPWSLAVTPENFAEQLEVLRRNLSIVALARLADGRGGTLPHRGVAITFDDGYLDNLTSARPMLERFDAPATIFLSSGAIGNPALFWWDDLTRMLLWPGTLPPRLELRIGSQVVTRDLAGETAYSDADALRHQRWRAGRSGPPPSRRHELYLTLWRVLQQAGRNDREAALTALREWAAAPSQSGQRDRPVEAHEVPALAAGELIEIGGHTVNHPALATLSPEEQRREIRQGKRELEQMIDRPVTSFAYPYGGRQDYTAETVALVEEAGFSRACSSFCGLVTGAADPMQLPRIYMDDWNGEQFARILSSWFGFRVG